FFQAEDGIRDKLVTGVQTVLFRSKAIVMNLLSIGAAYGLLVAAFEWGVGSPIGLISFGQIEGWIPVFLFAMLFGLSMDYEVFLRSEERRVGKECICVWAEHRLMEK